MPSSKRKKTKIVINTKTIFLSICILGETKGFDILNELNTK